jgi:hypothetical protein
VFVQSTLGLLFHKTETKDIFFFPENFTRHKKYLFKPINSVPITVLCNLFGYISLGTAMFREWQKEDYPK